MIEGIESLLIEQFNCKKLQANLVANTILDYIDRVNEKKKFNIYDFYYDEIRAFFEGTLSDILHPKETDKEYYAGHSRTKGHVWISEHKTFDILTVEPRDTGSKHDGNQYEIAVRFKNEESDEELTKYPGYSIGCDKHYFRGYGTGGH